MPTAAKPALREPGRIALRGGGELPLLDRPLVMGVLNITPDSFSDGGHWLHADRAVERAESLVGDGADILDLGAESTRPGGGVYGEGAVEVSEEEELARLMPVLEAIRPRIRTPISVDTRKARVARVALEAGADLVNDVSAMAEPAMAEVVAAADCSAVVMHSRGPLGDMQRSISFSRVVSEVVAELQTVVERAMDLGVDRSRLIVDPGIGFGKRAVHNLQLLRQLNSLHSLGLPILVGASRKSFIGEIAEAPPSGRLAGSLAAVGWAARHGAAIVRVHDVADTVQFLKLWRAIDRARNGEGIEA